MARRPTRRPGLLGRRSECEALERAVAGARGGESQVLVVAGEAGVGKTVLLEHLVDTASGCRVARAVGVESEMELAYSGLHQLCAPMLDRLERLPIPQREALDAALGRGVGGAPDRFLVGLATLSLISEVAEERPLVCVIDDAQWLDRASAQTLAFVARRLLAEPVAIVFALREPSDGDDLAGLPRLEVSPLSDADARTLLDSAIRGPLDEQLRDRFIAEARGNPLALVELPRGLTPAELAGGFGLTEVVPLAHRIELSLIRRLDALPADSRLLLLTAAAEPLGDAALLWRAADRLGLTAQAAGSARGVGFLDIGVRVRFGHPLMRSAVYRVARVEDRQRVHRALADATDQDADPDRRAWHHAQAAGAPDEALAMELERSAGRAQSRGGVAAAAAFLTRAAELTPDPELRAARALVAAQTKLAAGAPEAASELEATARLGPLDTLQQARLARLRGEIAFTTQRGGEAPRLLLDAARDLDALDAALARETHLEAMAASMFAGRLGTGPDVAAAAASARAAPRAQGVPRAIDLLVDGLATRLTDYAEGVAPVRHALGAFLTAGDTAQDDMRWLWLACRLAQDLWDDELWCELATRGVRIARETGALSQLPIADTYRAALCIHEGAFDDAAALIEESDAIVAATSIAPLKYAAIMLAAWRGDQAPALELFAECTSNATERGEGMALGSLAWSRALLFNGLGRHEEALAAAQRGCEHDDVGIFAWSLVEMVEAGARAGARDAADHALDQLSRRTRASGTDWALGIEAGARALLRDGATAEALHREAVERLGRTRGAVHLARAQLRYGEWLRREARRIDAREQLRAAHAAFSAMGAEGFAERARGELLATGETVRRRDAETRDVLTAQEARIARLAREGNTNAEIGAQLFLSPRTVEYHLHKVFSKLEISSRRELREGAAL